MAMERIYVTTPRTILEGGHQGENFARCICFPLDGLIEQYGEGTWSIVYRRPFETTPYVCINTEEVGDYAVWGLDDTDTGIPGEGRVELRYYVGEVLCKTDVYAVLILPALGMTGPAPEPYEDLVEQVAQLVAEAQDAERQAEQSAQTAAAQADRIISTTADAVGDWLEDNIGEISGYVIDKSLTVSDAAADAKVAGDWIRASFFTDEASGSVASFPDGADGVPVKDLTVGVQAQQSGTGDPSPNNVRSISGWSQANVTRTGKNLLNYLPQGTYSESVFTITVGADRSVVVNGTNSSSTAIILRQTVTLPAGRYTLNGDRAQNNLFLQIYNQTSGSVYWDTNLTFDYNGTDALQARLWIRASSTLTNATLYPMIRLAAETDDTYEPYTSTAYTVSFGSAGTVYGGTLDVTTGVLTVTKESVLLGTLSWGRDTTIRSADGATIHAFYATLPSAKVVENTTIANLLSSHFTADTYRAVDYGGGSVIKDNIIGGADNNHRVWAYGSAYNSMTTTEFKNAMSDVQLCYELASPQTYALTPTQVTSLLGNNNIFADCGASDVTYRADPRLYLEKLTNPDSDMTADANIASGSYFMVGNRLYLATSAISLGASIVPGTNCTATDLASALNAINA